MSFLQDILIKLDTDSRASILSERGGDPQKSDGGVWGRALLKQVRQASGFLGSKGLKKGDRCVLLGNNSIAWVAMDLAIMAQGLIVVPLYARQAPAELAAMVKDSSPALIICGSAELRDGLAGELSEATPMALFDEVSAFREGKIAAADLSDSDPVTIIYTSGTSGEAKGVMLTAGNVGHMLGCTSERLDALMGGGAGQDRVLHYLPFCFAGSWIMLLSCLLRGSHVTLNMDLAKLAGQMREVAPDYFLNVPQLLERMRKAVDEQLWKAGGFPLIVYARAKSAWVRKQERSGRIGDGIWLWAAGKLIFPTIRKKMIGANLKALICGSAPLVPETQLFFMMIGIPVLQVYGLTETTAICTMDDPGHVEPGRVGPAIRGIEMKLGENDEIVARGPTIFPGYWNRPEETAKVLRGGWFHTGDQGEVNAAGNWKIVGRIKNLIILGSGHNIAPEPIEDEILQELPQAQQVVLVGNARSYLSAILTGEVEKEKVQVAIDRVNAGLPHYKQVRAFHIRKEPFSIENGLLTANGKLKRDRIAQTLNAEIEAMYVVKQAS